MIKVFISHQKEDSCIASRIANELNAMEIPCYLDLLDFMVTRNGKELTDHIKRNLNNCTDIIVIMSDATRYSQWVPFEVGMSTQKDMPTATFMSENVCLPEFLDYWPRLKQPSDIRKYIAVRKSVLKKSSTGANFYKAESYMAESQRSQTERFYDLLKRQL
uniref:toll/interleukin-1 receptor domain-containing protein n=1 Tax=Succinivibrio sp. TaxID=2053619 RepID=UPI00402AF5B9